MRFLIERSTRRACQQGSRERELRSSYLSLRTGKSRDPSLVPRLPAPATQRP